MISFSPIFSCSDVSKMHINRILLFFIDTGAFLNNGKCITAVRGTYKCINHPLPGLGHIFVYNDSHLSLNQQYVLTVESLSLLISFLYLD